MIVKKLNDNTARPTKKCRTDRDHAVKTVKKAKHLDDLSMFKADCVTHCK